MPVFSKSRRSETAKESDFFQWVQGTQTNITRGIRERWNVMTREQIDSICLSYRHDFGLLSMATQEDVRRECRYWLEAIGKNVEIPTTQPLAQIGNAKPDRRAELLDLASAIAITGVRERGLPSGIGVQEISNMIVEYVKTLISTVDAAIIAEVDRVIGETEDMPPETLMCPNCYCIWPLKSNCPSCGNQHD